MITHGIRYVENAAALPRTDIEDHQVAALVLVEYLIACNRKPVGKDDYSVYTYIPAAKKNKIDRFYRSPTPKRPFSYSDEIIGERTSTTLRMKLPHTKLQLYYMLSNAR